MVSLVAASVFRRLAVSRPLRELRDLPNERKSHLAARSQIGGLAVLVAWVVAVVAVIHLFGAVERATVLWLRGIIAGLVLVACVGLVDDFQSQGPAKKLAVEGLALTLLFLNAGLLEPFADLPWIWQAAWVLGASLWALSLTNATNFIDGLDGLATGVTTLSAIGMIGLALLISDEAAAIAAACIAGVSLGFLRSNITPARVFLGDTGSLFLGMALSVVGLRIFSQQPSWTTAASLVLLSWIPLGDFLFAVIRRGARQDRIWSPDDGHVHHRLVRAGMAPKFAVTSLWLISALAVVAGIETFRHSRERLWALALLLATLPVLWTLWRASTADRRDRRRSTAEKQPTPALTRDRAA
jgi:UDP-GlcNAc:undecaprenyl-phosphate/decaprenyl-phosphate GlcNAc-1-phosphate transferase